MIHTTEVSNLTLDTPNTNGRVYPTDVVKVALVDYMQTEMICEFHDDYVGDPLNVTLSNASHVVRGTSISKGKLYIEIETLGTSRGKTLGWLIDMKLVDFYMRAIGYVGNDNCVTHIDRIISFDANPKVD
jgi:hypothetical protein